MTRTPWHDHLVPDWTRIRTDRPVVAPLLLGWALAGLSAWSIHPLLTHTSAASSETVHSLLLASLWIAALFAPLFALLRAGGLALLSWSAATLVGAHRPLRELLSIFLYGDCLRGLAGLLVFLWFHIATAVSGVAPHLVDPLSLAGFVSSSHVGWAAVTHMISLSGVAWLVYVGFALRRVSRLTPAAVSCLLAFAIITILSTTYFRASLGAS